MATYFTAAIPRINNQDADPALAGKPDRESVDDLDSYRGSLGGQRLLAHESAANDALTQYRLQALRALGDYGGLRGKDAIDGHDAYRQTLQDNRDRVFAKLPGAAQALLQPHLDRQHHEDLHFGMAHRAQQDKEWATKSALDALEADKREAMLRPGDLSLLQKLAERSDAEWMKIGQREGWLDDLVLRNAERAKADLIGRVVLTQLKDGDHAGARQTWEFAQNHVDPKTMIDAMRNKQIPGREQPYDNSNPLLGENANVRPQDVQLRSPRGQQLAQVQMPGNASDVPMLLGGEIGPQLAQTDGKDPAFADPPSGTQANVKQPGETEDRNGQVVLPYDKNPGLRFSLADNARYQKLLSYIEKAYGTAYAVQLQQSNWIGDGNYADKKFGFADDVVNSIFRNLAGSGKEVTQEDVDAAVARVMGDKKAVFMMPLGAIFIPRRVDQERALDGLYELKSKFTSDGPIWILQNVPGQPPALKQLEASSDHQWNARWVNIDADHYALVIPGQGFVADRDGHIRTVTIKDVMDVKVPLISKGNAIDLFFGRDIPRETRYTRPINPGSNIAGEKYRKLYKTRLEDSVRRSQGWLDIK